MLKIRKEGDTKAVFLREREAGLIEVVVSVDGSEYTIAEVAEKDNRWGWATGFYLSACESSGISTPMLW